MDVTADTPPSDTPAGQTAPVEVEHSVDRSIDNSSLDTKTIEPETGDFRPLERLTGAREPGFAVVIQRSTLNAVHAHGRSDTAVEICGVLVGNVHHDRISPYLLVCAHIPGAKASSKQTQVTFTADTWNEIQSAMERDHTDKKIVGWYHTHPGFGVFLSGMDLFIQDNFFNLPWQVAWVYDPIAQIDGAFLWKAGKSEKAPFLIEEDAATAPAVTETSELVPQKHSIAQLILTAVIFVAFFLLSWLLLGLLVDHGYRVRLPIDR